ncbi:MAG: hypothetical protein RL885_18875 [Planctomycetota bacterium]
MVRQLSVEDEELCRVTSGSEGAFEMTALDVPDSRLVASRRGYESATRRLPTDAEEEIRLELGLGVLFGQIVNADREPPDRPIHVVVHPARLAPPAPEEIEVLLNGGESPGMYVTMSQEDGTFQIEGLDLAEAYRVHAGGDGYCLHETRDPEAPKPDAMPAEEADGRAKRPQRSLITNVSAGPDPILLIVAGLYSIDYRQVDEEGREIPASPYLWSNPSPVQQIKGFEHRQVAYDEIGVQLACGTGRLVTAGMNRANDPFRLLTSLEDRDRLGPFKVRLALPGYEPRFEVDAWAIRLRNCESTQQEFVLKQTAEGFGAIDLRIESLQPGLQEQVESPRLYMYLIPKSEHLPEGAPSIQLWPGDGSPTIAHVPAGRYSVALDGYGMVLQPEVDPAELIVMAGRVTPLTIRTGEWGAVRFELSQGGEGYESLVFAQVIRKKISWGDKTFDLPKRVRWLGAPYELSALPAGEYEVSASRSPSPRKGGRTTTFFVSAGRIETVALELAD